MLLLLQPLIDFVIFGDANPLVIQLAVMKVVQLVVLDMQAVWPETGLLLFNTHLDPMNRANQHQQIAEIRAFMATELRQVQPLLAASSLVRCAGVLVGDFMREFDRWRRRRGCRRRIQADQSENSISWRFCRIPIKIALAERQQLPNSAPTSDRSIN